MASFDSDSFHTLSRSSETILSFIRENTCQRKPVFWHILCSDWQWLSVWWTLSTASLSYHHIIFSNLFSVSNTSPLHSCLKIYFKYGANNVLEILCTPYSRVIRTFYLFKECSDCIGALSAFVKSFLFFLWHVFKISPNTKCIITKCIIKTVNIVLCFSRLNYGRFDERGTTVR